MPPHRSYKKEIDEVAMYIASRPCLIEKIRQNDIGSLVTSLKAQFPQATFTDRINTGIFNDLASFLNNPKQLQEPNRYFELRAAIQERKEEKERVKRLRALFVKDCNLKEDDRRRAEYLQRLTTVQVDRYQTPYPSANKWVYESDTIHHIWHDYLQVGVPGGARLEVPHMMLLDPQQLQLDVSEDQSLIFVDSNTGEIIGLVARGWMPEGNKSTLDWVDEVIVKECHIRKSAPIGHTAVSGSQSSFHWVRNITSVENRKKDVEDMRSNVFSLLWNMCIGRLPTSITQGINYPANQNATSQALGSYTVQVQNEDIQFSSVQMAPPSGSFTQSYASATHNEKCPHKYALSWTTSRTYSTDEGGHFLIADYGIRIRQAANSLVVWKPTDFHGTTLSVKSPYDTNSASRQTVMSIATPVQLVELWEKYQEEQITAEEIEEILMQSQRGEEGAPVGGWD